MLRPLLGLASVVGAAVMTSSSGFLGGVFLIGCDDALLGGGGVGGTLGADFARIGGDGVGTGWRLGPSACADCGRFVVNFDASGAGSIFGVGQIFGIDKASRPIVPSWR